MIDATISRRIADTFDDKPVTFEERRRIAAGAEDVSSWGELSAEVRKLLNQINDRPTLTEADSLAITAAMPTATDTLHVFHLPGQHDQASHAGGVGGDAALAAAPLRLVDNKVNPISGKVTSKPGPGMSEQEAKSLARYREAGFVKVNKSLRKSGGEVPAGLDGRTVNDIDSAMARSHLTADVSVERGISHGPATFGGDRWQGDLTGTRFVDHGFVSTTTSHQIAGEFADRIPGVSDGGHAHLHVPAGTPAIQLSGREHESELLLGRGLTFEITSDTGPGPNRQITMAVVQ